MGEIGLSGELRRVRDLPQRLSEAARLGFSVAVVPAEPGERSGTPRERRVDGMRVFELGDVRSALEFLRLTTPVRESPLRDDPGF
jgi:DNA repair protein RadA/Sms